MEDIQYVWYCTGRGKLNSQQLLEESEVYHYWDSHAFLDRQARVLRFSSQAEI